MVLEHSSVARAEGKLRGSLKLLGSKGSLVELLGYGGNWGNLWDSHVCRADGPIHEWWSGPEDEWKGKIAAGAA